MVIPHAIIAHVVDNAPLDQHIALHTGRLEHHDDGQPCIGPRSDRFVHPGRVARSSFPDSCIPVSAGFCRRLVLAAGEIPSVSPVLRPSWRPRAVNNEKVG